MAVLDELLAILGFDFQGQADADRYRRTLNGVDGQLQNVSRRAVGFGKLITGAIVALGASQVIGSAVSFEEAIADINKVVDATPEQISELSEELLRMSRELPVSAEGLAAIAAEAGAAGVAFEDLPGFARQVALAVTAFDLPAEQVGETMSKLANVFGFNIEQIGHFNDTVNHLSNNMAAKAGELLNFTNRAAGAATLLGLTADQLAGVGAALIAAGVIPETAARGLNAFATRVQTDAKGVSEALALIGLTTEELQNNLARDGDNALIEVFQSLSELDVSQQASALKALVGQDFSDDFSKFLANPDLLAQGFALANDEVGKLGSAQAEFEARAATTAAKWQRIKNVLISVGVILAGPILSGFKVVADFVFKIVEAFDGAATSAEGLESVLQGLGLPFDITDIEFFRNKVVGAFEGIKNAVTGLVQLWRDRIGEFTSSETFSTIVDTFSEAAQKLGDIWTKLQEVLSSEGGQMMIQIINQVTDALFQLWASVIGQGLAAGVDLLATSILGLVTAFGQLINGDFQGAIDTLIETFKSLDQIILDSLIALSEFAATFATDLGAAIGDGIRTGVQSAIDYVKDRLNALVESVRATFASLNPFGGDEGSSEIRRSGGSLRDGGGTISRVPVTPPSRGGVAADTPQAQAFQQSIASFAEGLGTAASVADDIGTSAPGLVEQTLNTDNTKNITNEVINNISVQQNVSGAASADEAARAVTGAANRGTSRGLNVNNLAADA